MTRRSRVLLGVCCIYCCVTEVKGEVDGLVTGDCGTFATLKCIVNHIRVVTFTNQNPWNGLHVAKFPQSPETSPIPRVLIGGCDPPLCFTCCKDFTISCTFCTHILNPLSSPLPSPPFPSPPLPSFPLPSPPLPFPPLPSPSLLPFRRATPLAGWTRMKSWRSSVRVRMRQSTGALASE